jgi:acyl-coenzyme A synthetase/AMP-(fatty) acid ligase
MAHCREKLEDFMVPREVEFVEELPKTASGKVDRWRLAEKENQGVEALKR